MATNFLSIYNKLQQKNLTTADKGRAFEELMQKFLQHDPLYKKRFSNVWLWSEFPYAPNKKDLGIDLVAQDAQDETKFCAIQCKLYDSNTIINKAGIDTFISQSSKTITLHNGQNVAYDSRIIISTAQLNANAMASIYNQNPPVQIITLENLQESPLDWQALISGAPKVLLEKKQPRDYQQIAIDNCVEGLLSEDRGKLIMPCGSGKTFTALKIIEKLVMQHNSPHPALQTKKNVLFIVPSLSLLDQTLREFNNQETLPFAYYAICSDEQIGKVNTPQGDEIKGELIYLSIPATTDAQSLILHHKYQQKQRIFIATYHSLPVIMEAQKLGFPDFDVVVIDEAHKSVGIGVNEKSKIDEEKTKIKDDDSFFTLIHSDENIRAKKRLYMTATPKIYKDSIKKQAKDLDMPYYSMDDEAIFGKTFYHLTFSDAVAKGILTDYEVLILTIDEQAIDNLYNDSDISYSLNQIRTKVNKQDLQLNDVAKIVGCYNALAGNIIKSVDMLDSPVIRMSTALAFCSSIATSQLIQEQFSKIVNLFDKKSDNTNPLHCTIKHIDGSMGNNERVELLNWLAQPKPSNSCHILSNAKVLTEGIDVPSLDAIIFMNSKKSEVDIIQAVGRVMRKAPNKNKGYIILPIVISSQENETLALDNNDEYSRIWDVITALKSHDESFDIPIDQFDFAKNTISKKVSVASANIGSFGKIKNANSQNDAQNHTHSGDAHDKSHGNDDKLMKKAKKNLQYKIQYQMDFANVAEKVANYREQILAKIVKNCGSKEYTLKIVENMQKAVNYTISSIQDLLQNDKTIQLKFTEFVNKLKLDINDSINALEAVDMIATHIITKPVFNSLFEQNVFVKNNVVGINMENMLSILEQKNSSLINNDYLKLYNEMMKKKLEGVQSFGDKQEFIKNFYGEFIAKAFPKDAQKHGVVYTPIEVIDFIINSTQDVLVKHFNSSLANKDVNILDPFSGTGTFITRLIQSGLLGDNLEYKYSNEIFANEILLFSYYVANINIESAFEQYVKRSHASAKHIKDAESKKYVPFNGMVLTDTFNMNENDDNLYYGVKELQLADNSQKISQQKNTPIKVIIGNPPYSAGQSNTNDNNQNLKYPKLDKSIAETYVKDSVNNNKNSLYDSYIRAIKWSTNRLSQQNQGIVSFITNSSFLKSNSGDGIRKHLMLDYNQIYIIDLKGNSRNLAEARAEGGNIFDIRAGVCILILVKDGSAEHNLYYHNIGDGIKKEEKLQKLVNLKSISNVKFEVIKPNDRFDWFNLREQDSNYNKFMLLGSKDKANEEVTIFNNYSNGIKTNRDAWVYNYSKEAITKNMQNTIAFYNNEVERFECALQGAKYNSDVANFVNNNPIKISWTEELQGELTKKNQLEFDEGAVISAMYRPFQKQFLYYNKDWNSRHYQMPKIFVKNKKNIALGITGAGANKDFSSFIISEIADVHSINSAQYFPLYTYAQGVGLFGTQAHAQISNVNEVALNYFRAKYNTPYLSDEDVFFYCYAVLNSKKYIQRYKNEISRGIPRIPLLQHFYDYVDLGKKLAQILLNYESHPHLESLKVEIKQPNYRVDKMKFVNKEDKSTIIYNQYITIANIPPQAYEYVVNGKSAIAWVMDRYQVKVHKDSHIENNPNLYANEIGDEKYILNLLLSVISLSVEVVDLTNQISELDML